MKTNITLSAITHTIVEITGSKLAGGTVDLPGGRPGPLCPLGYGPVCLSSVTWPNGASYRKYV